ncbi:MAG: hypothetical protein ABIJ56_00310 [Pseudomonadota bacterium]
MKSKNRILLAPAALMPAACAGHHGGGKTQEEPIMNTPKTDETTQELMMPDPTDVSSIDAIVKAMYASICFDKGKEPGWQRLRTLLSPGARLIAAKKDKLLIMGIEEFISLFRENIKKGDLKSFHESEVFRHTDTFGNIAQVFSTYESRFLPQDEKPFTRGINSIQLHHDGKRWWISGIVWDDEREDNPVPRENLP